MKENTYNNIAKVWDWDGYDNTPEYEYWCDYASQYGKKVLIPMCALGLGGAYLARHGFDVTAFDLSAEMIDEGRRRIGTIDNLSMQVADIRSFSFDNAPFDFTYIQDLHLLPSINDVKEALHAIHPQLRTGGGMVLELTLPHGESETYEKRVFYPRVPNYTDKKVWKEHEGYYDAETKTNHISQMVIIETDSGIEKIPYVISLQYYDRALMLSALEDCGFDVKNEYKNRDKEPWREGDHGWIVEAVKR
jgi:cyclopropane fatty-acyl-phospholipid synthase-like methyltransferase